jgi:hypothetical protein
VKKTNALDDANMYKDTGVGLSNSCYASLILVKVSCGGESYIGISFSISLHLCILLNECVNKLIFQGIGHSWSVQNGFMVHIKRDWSFMVHIQRVLYTCYCSIGTFLLGKVENGFLFCI